MLDDQGLLPVPTNAALFEARVADEERSSEPNDELSPAIPVAAPAPALPINGEAKDANSPNPVLPDTRRAGAEEAAAGFAANSDMMSFLSLALELVVALVVALVAALVAGVDAEGSCQSSSKIPPPPPTEALVGAVAAAAEGCLVVDATGATGATGAAGAAGAGEGDGSSSRSIAGTGFLAALAELALAADLAAANEEVLAAATADGAASAPPSKTLGSLGGGPSLAHLLDSYLLLMNDSIL